jgi:DNA mismatch repair protein MutS
MARPPHSSKPVDLETPLMTQYRAVKAQHPDAVLFFRMGDFYEMFYEDARTGSGVLGLTLTSRGHGKTGDVPLAGFPYHALDGYLSKMIRAGYRVAICDQVEDPKLAKGVVKREVTQVVTPGTVIDENLLESRRSNFLTAVLLTDDLCGLASADVSTGEFLVTEFPAKNLLDEIQSVRPAEILVPESQADLVRDRLSARGPSALITRRENWIFDRAAAHDSLTRHFGTTSLKGFGCEDLGPGLGAAGAVLSYLRETRKNELRHIRGLRRYSDGDYMILDASARRNLEITSSMSGRDKDGTLISIIDKTRTPMGGRLLASWVSRPLKQLPAVRRRLDAVEELVGDKSVRRSLSDRLKGMNDMERLVARTVSGKASPRDLTALAGALERIPELQKTMAEVREAALAEARDGLESCVDVAARIRSALVDTPPVLLADGGFIREGYSADLDSFRKLAFSGKDGVAGMQKTERARTGIASLKVDYNRIFGYYIEVTRPHLNKIPGDYIRKQTLVNAERFVTPELKDMEEKILKAEEKSEELERELFEALRQFVSSRSNAIQNNAVRIAELDCLLSLADAAEEYRYVKPVVDEGGVISIEQGRHPVVERLLPAGTPFIPNDAGMSVDENQIAIITGPNMAGKSTYIRQVGLIVLMAQIGSFVPARSARIGLVDRIFTRVGAHDNLAGGESTFLVEMNETANILNNVTPRSLVLLDEIGRGTSTFDGLSIAWAVAEYLHHKPNARAMTLFATHYHELTELALILPRVKNFNIAIREWGDHIVFLRKIVPGGCDHSYGIQVARLAGLPVEVIDRAKKILANLEANELTPNEVPKLALGETAYGRVAEPQMDMFMEEEKRIRDELKKIDVDRLTPVEALKKLDELKKLISE